MDGLFSLLAIALFIEGVLSYGQTIVKEHKIQWQIVAALLLAGLFCWNADISFFQAFGFVEKVPAIGYIATAIVLSRGSNYLFEMYKQLTRWRDYTLETNYVVGATEEYYEDESEEEI